jgi:hypothetical protein
MISPSLCLITSTMLHRDRPFVSSRVAIRVPDFIEVGVSARLRRRGGLMGTNWRRIPGMFCRFQPGDQAMPAGLFLRFSVLLREAFPNAGDRSPGNCPLIRAVHPSHALRCPARCLHLLDLATSDIPKPLK